MISADVSLGQLIAPAITIIGGIGALFTMRAMLATLTDRTSSLGSRLGEAEVKHDALQRQVDRDCVQRSELKEVEQRLGSRITEVEHSVRSIPMQVVGLLNQTPPGPSRRRRPEP